MSIEHSETSLRRWRIAAPPEPAISSRHGTRPTLISHLRTACLKKVNRLRRYFRRVNPLAAPMPVYDGLRRAQPAPLTEPGGLRILAARASAFLAPPKTSVRGVFGNPLRGRQARINCL
jgi:hypothetical protein